MPEPALLSALHQPASRCAAGQFLLHHARNSSGRHRCSQWVRCSRVRMLHILKLPQKRKPVVFRACPLSLTDDRSRWVRDSLVNRLSRSSFHSLVIDVTMALDTLSLPVLEPLSPPRLQDVTVLSLSCLYAGEQLRLILSSAKHRLSGNHETFCLLSPLFSPFPQGPSSVSSRWDEVSVGVLKLPYCLAAALVLRGCLISLRLHMRVSAVSGAPC